MERLCMSIIDILNKRLEEAIDPSELIASKEREELEKTYGNIDKALARFLYRPQTAKLVSPTRNKLIPVMVGYTLELDPEGKVHKVPLRNPKTGEYPRDRDGNIVKQVPLKNPDTGEIIMEPEQYSTWFDVAGYEEDGEGKDIDKIDKEDLYNKESLERRKQIINYLLSTITTYLTINAKNLIYDGSTIDRNVSRKIHNLFDRINRLDNRYGAGAKIEWYLKPFIDDKLTSVKTRLSKLGGTTKGQDYLKLYKDMMSKASGLSGKSSSSYRIGSDIPIILPKEIKKAGKTITPMTIPEWLDIIVGSEGRIMREILGPAAVDTMVLKELQSLSEKSESKSDLYEFNTTPSMAAMIIGAHQRGIRAINPASRIKMAGGKLSDEEREQFLLYDLGKNRFRKPTDIFRDMDPGVYKRYQKLGDMPSQEELRKLERSQSSASSGTLSTGSINVLPTKDKPEEPETAEKPKLREKKPWKRKMSSREYSDIAQDALDKLKIEGDEAERIREILRQRKNKLKSSIDDEEKDELRKYIKGESKGDMKMDFSKVISEMKNHTDNESRIDEDKRSKDVHTIAEAMSDLPFDIDMGPGPEAEIEAEVETTTDDIDAESEEPVEDIVTIDCDALLKLLQYVNDFDEEEDGLADLIEVIKTMKPAGETIVSTDIEALYEEDAEESEDTIGDATGEETEEVGEETEEVGEEEIEECD